MDVGCLRLRYTPASALMLCLTTVLLVDVGMDAIAALRAGVSCQKAPTTCMTRTSIGSYLFPMAAVLEGGRGLLARGKGIP